MHSEYVRLLCELGVVGLGLFQGLEFMLRRSPFEILGKSAVAWSRFRVARKLFRRSEVYRLVLGRDSARNAETVFEFVQRRLGRGDRCEPV